MRSCSITREASQGLCDDLEGGMGGGEEGDIGIIMVDLNCYMAETMTTL